VMEKSNSDQDIKFISTQKQKKRNSQYDTSQPATQSHLNDIKRKRCNTTHLASTSLPLQSIETPRASAR
jgi:hypothetical protein